VLVIYRIIYFGEIAVISSKQLRTIKKNLICVGVSDFTFGVDFCFFYLKAL